MWDRIPPTPTPKNEYKFINVCLFPNFPLNLCGESHAWHFSLRSPVLVAENWQRCTPNIWLLFQVLPTHQALCWKTCRGSVRNRVPNWGLFPSPVSEPTEPRWASLRSSSAPAVLRGAAMLELTFQMEAGRHSVLGSRKIGSSTLRICTLNLLCMFCYWMRGINKVTK